MIAAAPQPQPVLSSPVPPEVVACLHAYGDSRADDDGLSGLRIAEAIVALRRWAAAAKAAEPQPQPVTHDALRCAVGNCTFNGEVDSHAPGCPSALAQPQPVQEPVARVKFSDDAFDSVDWIPYQGQPLKDGDLLFTSPQAQPQPVQEPVAPVGTVTRYLGNDGYMKWAFQPEAAAWLVPRDQRAAERGAESCFSVYTSPQAQPLIDDASPISVLLAVEESIKNGGCPWQIEQAFDEYEAQRQSAITKGTT